ncbi:hypothetical protein DT076_14280 [Desertihabitans brevis]|uniref:Aminoglycoside phosphotransferase domain-containing protein n=1 Tax=Desertihabitans brevis TaxID=2268447 RepID=A0A367YSF1_9ACTN|nr:hypothetical protein [Desertihabitans brevis]RCK68748.1 hypothetical protein DT076_14280 [Desertihabitans brevis]
MVVAGRFPTWAALPVRSLPSDGTVNLLLRVGEEVVARFPLQPAPLPEVRTELGAEAAAAVQLAALTGVPVPEPLAVVADREQEWQGGRAWALVQAAGCLAYYEDTNPAMSRLARTLGAVLEG